MIGYIYAYGLSLVSHSIATRVLRLQLVLLLLQMVGHSARIQVNNNSILLQQPMELEPFIPVLLVH
jgi:hypothetical protein